MRWACWDLLLSLLREAAAGFAKSAGQYHGWSMTTVEMTEQRMVERLTQRWVAEGESGEVTRH